MIMAFFGLLLFFFFFVFNFYCGERTPVNSGWGWDGVRYAQTARTDPIVLLKEKKLDKYYIKRVLPPVLVHYGSKILGGSLGEPIDALEKLLENEDFDHMDEHIKSTEPQKVVSAFYIYNCVLLLLGIYIWSLIRKEFNWSPLISSLSFIALFINYPVLKFSIVYPVLTDISGLVMGLFIFYLYLKDKTFSFFIASFLASFTWPSMLCSVMPLLVFKVQKLALPIFITKKSSNILAGIFAISMVSITLYFSYYSGDFLKGWEFCTISTKILILSAPVMILYIFLGLRQFIDVPYIFSQLKKNITLSRILLACGLFFAVKAVSLFVSNNNAPPFGSFEYLLLICRYGMLFPLMNVVFHGLDFGPFFLLIIFLWKDFVQVVKEKGLGLMLFVCLFTLLSVGSESRQYLPAWPVFSLLICEVLNRRGVSWSFFGLISIVSLILSRFWLTYAENSWTGGIHKMIEQKMGMTIACYIVFLCVAFIVFISLFPVLKPFPQVNLLKFLKMQFAKRAGLVGLSSSS
jgi:hypothetical protein